MTSHDLYVLLHLLEKYAEECATDESAHLAVIVLKMGVEKRLTQRQELG